MKTFKISEEYSKTPGPRYESEGKFSGEHFRKTVLIGLYLAAVEKNEKVRIDLDGGYGYSPSFLEEAFGGLARQYDIQSVKQVFIFVSNDEPSLVEEINEYIEYANSNIKEK